MKHTICDKLEVRDKFIEDLEAKVKEQQMQAEYQSHLREQYFQDALRKQREEASAKLVEAQDRNEELRRAREVQQREAVESIEKQEKAHMKAAEELEHLYERKLAMEAARWEALRKEKEDRESQLEERIYSLGMIGKEAESRLKGEKEEVVLKPYARAPQQGREGEDGGEADSVVRYARTGHIVGSYAHDMPDAGVEDGVRVSHD